jgi:hypothetical protein
MMKPENKPPRFAILLSTYNGTAYLPELLESIVSQSWKHWDLWIRDDGSRDGTRKLLEDFARRFNSKSPGECLAPRETQSEGNDNHHDDASEAGADTSANRIHLFTEENMGVAASFFQLLEQAGGGYDGYAFCDQDDIWLPEKLERAALALDPGRPMLYHARQWLFEHDSGDKTLSPLPVRARFSNALVQNQVVGCTMVINAILRECVLKSLQTLQSSEATGSPPRIIMHDWWCYLLGSGTGTVSFDPEPVILFRRHGQSATPAALGSLTGGRRRLTAFRRQGWSISHIMDQADLLHQYFTSGQTDSSCRLQERHLLLLEKLVNLRSAGVLKRVGYLFTGRHRRSRPAETLLFRLLILLRRF